MNTVSVIPVDKIVLNVLRYYLHSSLIPSSVVMMFEA